MNDFEHPENLLPCGSLPLDTGSIQNEIAADRYAIGISVAGLVSAVGLGVGYVAPELAQAVGEQNTPNIAQYGILAAICGHMVKISTQNLRVYIPRFRQAKINKQLLDIACKNEIDPTE